MMHHLILREPQLTLEAWVYPSSFQPNVWQGNVINKAGVSQTGYMLRVGNGGQVNFNLGTGSWNELNSAVGVVGLNTWSHIAGTYDGTTMRLYVNGVELITLPMTSNISTSPNGLLLGDDPAWPGRFFPGRIDEVRVWNVTRTPAQIIEDMTNTCGVIPANLKAYYRFNQGVAGGNNTGLTTLNDETGVNNGTLISFSLAGSLSNWVTGKYTPNSVTNNSVSICQGDSVLIFGIYQDMSGTYQDTLLAANGCGDSLIVTTLTALPPLTSTTNASICQGDSILLGGSFQTIAGSYVDFLQTPNGCDSLLITILAVNPLPIVSIAAFSPDTICSGNAPVILPVGTPILGVYSGNGVNGGDFDPAISGVGSHFITYTIIDGNGCSNSDSTAVVVEICVGVNEANVLSNIDVFPNPTKDVLTINVSDKDHKNLTMKLVDLTGKTIKTIVILENVQNMKLNIADLNKGIYFLIVSTTSNNGVYKITKL